MKIRIIALSVGLTAGSLSPVVSAQNDPISNAIGTVANAANGVIGSNPSRSPATPARGASRRHSARVPTVRALPANAPRAALRATADGYMSMNLGSFLAVRRVHPPPFDWAANGCSFGEVSGPFRESFNRACSRHEFGYRNYGGRGLALDRTEARRARIDSRLRDDLNGLCRSEHGGLTEAPCIVAAQAIYGSARSAGSSWFTTGTGRPPSVPTPSVPGLGNGQNNGANSPVPGLPIPGLNGAPIQLPGLGQ